MGTRTLILGGGFGGLATATVLRERLGDEHEIVLVDRRETFYMGLRKLWLLAAIGTIDEGRRPLDALAARGIRVVRAEIRSIDPAARRVETDDGALDGDYLVVALGAEPWPEKVPGLTEHAFNLYDAGSVERAAERIAALDAGRVIVAVAGLPYKCPPAPYEAAMLLHDHFSRRGVRDRIELTFTTLQPMLLPNAGPEGARWIGDELTRRNIAYRTGAKVDRIEAGRIVFHDEALAFDIALVAPPHRAPAVVRESGLAGDDGWIAVNPGTLATAFPNVFAIGDVTHIPLANQMPLPKAGVFAEAQGRRVAAAIVADVAGTAPPRDFDGEGYCFVEMGGGLATTVHGRFYAAPAPDVRLGEPSVAGLEAKHRYETERLTRWFGG